MTIDGTNIWEWNLFLTRVRGLYNQPARKKTLNEWSWDEKDIVFENKVVTIYLAGEFNDTETLKNKIESFREAMKFNTRKTIELPNYNKTLEGWVKDGVKIDIHRCNTLVLIRFKIIVDET